jgi:pantothenate kinase
MDTLTTVSDVCARLELLVDRAGGASIIFVGVSGVPGSGKTTLVAQLVNTLRAAHGDGWVAALPMDGFHLPRSTLDEMSDPARAHARRGSPFTFSPDGFASCIEALRKHGSGSAPGFDHVVGDPEPGAIVIPAGVRLVIVEGNYLLLGRLEDGHTEADGTPLAAAWREVDSALVRWARENREFAAAQY